MNRNKLKAYAPQARRDFIKAVTDRAAYYGLIKDKIEPIIEQGDVAIIAGRAFPGAVAAKRKRLEERIRRQGFDQVMEAMAYTWFNRFVAIRFMELHGYLDHGYRVLSTTNHTNERRRISRSCNDSWLPEILEYGEHVDLPGVDQDKVVELKLAGNKDEELYRMLLIAQCNALHKAMPFLFEWINDATELLLPENLLHSDSVIRKLVKEIPEEDWREVEIIGWLYQFYISEKKDQVIGKVVKSEDIPAATQLFTPNWIVKYIVQNTLGRQWMATYPNSSLKQQMEFYIEPAEQTPEVQEQLKAITPDSLNPEELTLLDPACGSGHILVEAYDLLKTIYQERGYRKKDIPRLILEKNLYGLEIDDRSAQLAAFALMIKARADDRHIFENETQPHVLAIQESKGLDAGKMTEALNEPILKVELPPREFLFEEMEEERAPLFSRKNLSVKGDICQADVAQLIDLFEHGKTFGSLIRVPGKLAEKLAAIGERVEDVLAYGEMFGQAAARALRPIVEQAWVLARHYDAITANPPYMGASYFNSKLKAFLEMQYANFSGDLYAAFSKMGLIALKRSGILSFITIPTWLFLPTFERMRIEVLQAHSLELLVDNGRGIWGSDFGSCIFAIRQTPVTGYRGKYIGLSINKGAVSSVKELQHRFLTSRPVERTGDDFAAIPGCPISCYVPDPLLHLFSEHRSLDHLADVRQGVKTGDIQRFVRYWHEVDFCNIFLDCQSREQSAHDRRRWYPCNKGGDYRKWYGNLDYVLDWQFDGDRIRNFRDQAGRLKSRPQNLSFFFREGITWSTVTMGKASFRLSPKGRVFESGGSTIFPKAQEDLLFLLGYLNSALSIASVEVLSPKVSLGEGAVARIPVGKVRSKERQEIVSEVEKLIRMHEQDWTSCEESFSFSKPCLLRMPSVDSTVEKTWKARKGKIEASIGSASESETRINQLLIQLLGIEGHLSPSVSNGQITLTRPDREEEIGRLISYAIGCMMGRYSLDKPRLIYAHSGNQDFDPSQYKTFPADMDGIIPITDTDWFPDDATNRVVEFIEVAWPKEHLEENIRFMAESLGPKRGESPRDTLRRYLFTGFYKHHLSIYKKRPIYWLFSSGKQRAFQCLVYLHRYNEGNLSRMRTEYVIPLQGKIGARIDHLEADSKAATSTSHRKKLEREQDKLVKQQAELQAFDEKLRHYADRRISLDLDDGVKVNYGKFGDLLAEVKAVTVKKKE